MSLLGLSIYEKAIKLVPKFELREKKATFTR